MPQICRNCENPATRRCSGCKVSSTWYCGKECQQEHWVIHIFECNPRKPINTAYYLARDCRRDRLPDDHQTCEDYGFSRAFTAENRSKLLGLYIGLFNYLNVSPKMVHSWRLNGTLVEKIKESFEELPVSSRGGYYPWFLENQYILEETKVVPIDHIHETLLRAWRYAGEGSPSSTPEEIASVLNTWSESKLACFSLYTWLLSSSHPSPDQFHWVKFGFCVCRDEWSETSVSALYNRLIARCTFQEFYTAYQSSALISLFRTKELGTELRNVRHLEDVLENCPVSNKSVWDLKQYVVASKGVLIPSVTVDYGFANCRTEEETMELKEVYKKFFDHFKSDPIQLHEAAIGGRLFEYVGTFVKLKKNRFSRLMKNPYPLLIL
jgi:hypothetical protein